MRKIYDKDIAKFYGLSANTMSNYKKNEKGRLKYNALRNYYIDYVNKETNHE